MFRAVLSNPQHPEHGQVTVPFPLAGDAYPQTLELLRALDLGDPTGRDCQIDEISGGYSVLKRLEGGMVNLDELDYLAKRLGSFDDDQGIQFEAVAAARDISSIEDFINLTFCCDQVTVIYDFSDLEAVGRRHYLNTHSGCASVEELDHLDGQETALLLIDGGGGVITPYGVLYENGMRMEPLYQGGPFPAYPLLLGLDPAHAAERRDRSGQYASLSLDSPLPLPKNPGSDRPRKGLTGGAQRDVPGHTVHLPYGS